MRLKSKIHSSIDKILCDNITMHRIRRNIALERPIVFTEFMAMNEYYDITCLQLLQCLYCIELDDFSIDFAENGRHRFPIA